MDRLSMADLRWFETLSWLKCSCSESLRVHALHEYPSILSYLEDITDRLYYKDVSEDGEEAESTEDEEDEQGGEEAERKRK
jgi:Ran GTPase-activating protein (RanGAP) involved in mRNA processing and transport